MARLFVGNFSFEEQRRPGAEPVAAVRRLEAELACVWLAVAETGDFILCPESVPDDYWERMTTLGCADVVPVLPTELPGLHDVDELVPWGWSPPVRELAAKLGDLGPVPDQADVWRVNSRRFSVELETSLNVQPAGIEVIGSLEELRRAIGRQARFPNGWRLKSDFGQSGRGQLRGRGDELTPSAVNWGLRRLAEDGLVILEPNLDRIAEYGGQWEIPVTGEPRLIGVTRLLTDNRGQYRGTEVADELSRLPVMQELLTVQRLAAEQVQAAGYFGPLGIDAMQFRDARGGIGLRPLQDLNARWTMGRLALGWSSRMAGIAKRVGGTWLHIGQPPAPSALCLSPVRVGGRNTRQRTWWLPAEFRREAAGPLIFPAQ